MQNQGKNSLIKELVNEMQGGGFDPNQMQMMGGQAPMMQQPMMQPMMQQPMMQQPMMRQQMRPMQMGDMDDGGNDGMESMAPASDMEVEMDDLEEEDRSMLDRLFNMFRDPLIIAGLFVLLNLPHVNKLLTRFLPMIGNNMYYSLILRGLVLGLLFYLIRYFL
jgi:hypothetical protein